jgi:hypothetical protein
MLHALLEFKRRTEYKLLNQFTGCQFVSVKELRQGILVLPGFVLQKMTGDELAYLNRWLDCLDNQLVILPSWTEINLKPLFQLPLPLSVVSMEEAIYYDDIPVSYRIEGKYKDILYETRGTIFGVQLRRDTGSGLITVVTLPLLDYKLPQLHDKFQEILQGLFKHAEKTEGKGNKVPEMFTPDEVQVYLLILLASGEDFSSGLSRKLERYFFHSISEDILVDKFEALKAAGFVENNQLTPKAVAFVKGKKLKAFIRLIRERRESTDGWE